MPTKLKIKTPEGVKEVGLSDVRPYTLYDTVTYAAATAKSEDYFFRTPEGKTLVDTNLKQFSTIQVGWTFEVASMRIIPRCNISIADMETLFTGSVVTFLREGDIEIFTMPTIMLNAGCGLYGATTNTAEDIVSLGLPSAGAVHRNAIRFLLYGGETFNFRITHTPAVTLAAERKIYLVLDGILKRGVRGA